MGAPVRLAGYRIAARLIARLPLSGKPAASLAGRRGAAEYWAGYRNQHQRRQRVIWCHAASVGEALVLEPVIQRLRTALKEVEVILTYSSASLAAWPLLPGVDAAGFAPAETPGSAASVFDSIRPDLLVFSRSDLWPEMLLAAADRKVPVTVIGGVVRQGTARTRWPARAFLRRLYRRLAFVGAVTKDDAERWDTLGAPSISITGDPRHDQVLERDTDLRALRSLRPWAEKGPTLVAGSVEPEDEMPLLAAAAETLKNFPEARILLVPHDPATVTIRRILAKAGGAPGISSQLLEREQPPTASCVIVSQQGILASLYSVGSVSYVGGGFCRGKLHAVIEPAAYGVPAMIGPEFAGSADAVRLVSVGGAVPLPRNNGEMVLASTWTRWLRDESERSRAGIAARGCLSQGAAGITARHLLALLP